MSGLYAPIPDEPTLVFTCDIDWAPEEVIADTLDLLSEAGVRCTLFATHASQVLEGCDPHQFEVALHPNFNPVLQGAGGSAEEVLSRLRDIYPDATGVRSHSATQSSMLSAMYVTHGLRYESNTLLPYVPTVLPFRAWDGMARISFNWEDDVHFMYQRSFADCGLDLTGPGYRIFTFHPVHIYINTESSERYDSARPSYHDAKALYQLRNRSDRPGSRDLFRKLIDIASRQKASPLLGEIEAQTPQVNR
jgi:hypothetical protein